MERLSPAFLPVQIAVKVAWRRSGVGVGASMRSADCLLRALKCTLPVRGTRLNH
jgi:hypothetical protein